MQIDILIQDNYGTKRYYPQNEAADYFAKISKTKTLDRHQLAYIEALGAEINYFVMLNGSVVKLAKGAA